uniref:Uncharacterized protein n=1 Tax=Corethron hystrix TaxID=216773 RepID=A0A7S1G2D5_9STRA|mmetsp:Transcript_8167/g.17744  ORF Transcript_8167/g.17744 Transcript_8167/m.17744 type:complete len:266 (+) Transcript_8167:135-932(+)
MTTFNDHMSIPCMVRLAADNEHPRFGKGIKMICNFRILQNRGTSKSCIENLIFRPLLDLQRSSSFRCRSPYGEEKETELLLPFDDILAVDVRSCSQSPKVSISTLSNGCFEIFSRDENGHILLFSILRYKLPEENFSEYRESSRHIHPSLSMDSALKSINMDAFAGKHLKKASQKAYPRFDFTWTLQQLNDRIRELSCSITECGSCISLQSDSMDLKQGMSQMMNKSTKARNKDESFIEYDDVSLKNVMGGVTSKASTDYSMLFL